MNKMSNRKSSVSYQHVNMIQKSVGETPDLHFRVEVCGVGWDRLFYGSCLNADNTNRDSTQTKNTHRAKLTDYKITVKICLSNPYITHIQLIWTFLT